MSDGIIQILHVAPPTGARSPLPPPPRPRSEAQGVPRREEDAIW